MGRLTKCTGPQCILDYHEYDYNSHNYLAEYNFTYNAQGRLSGYAITSITAQYPVGYYQSKHIFSYSNVNNTLQVSVNLSWQTGAEKGSNNYILYYNDSNQLIKDNQVDAFVYDEKGNLIHWDDNFGRWHDYVRTTGPSFEYDYLKSIYGDFLMATYFFTTLKIAPDKDAYYNFSFPQYTLFNSFGYDKDGNIVRILTRICCWRHNIYKGYLLPAMNLSIK